MDNVTPHMFQTISPGQGYKAGLESNTTFLIDSRLLQTLATACFLGRRSRMRMRVAVLVSFENWEAVGAVNFSLKKSQSIFS